MERPEQITINDVDYLTMFGASKALNISESTLKREVATRKIQTLKHPKGNLFIKDWLDDWIIRKTTLPRKSK